MDQKVFKYNETKWNETYPEILCGVDFAIKHFFLLRVELISRIPQNLIPAKFYPLKVYLYNII